MIKDFTTKLKKATKEDLYEISLSSSMAKSKEVFIFEKGEMSDLFEREKAEEIRKNFVKNNVKVKQITNIPVIPKFTGNGEFVNKVMTFRYVPKDIFKIENEILIFDDNIAIYNNDELLIINDKKFAENLKQLFVSIWEQGQSPRLEFEYKPNHSFYKDMDFFLDGLQIIVWPDVGAKDAYQGFSRKELENYIFGIIRADKYYTNASYIVIFLWSLDGEKMVDAWKFSENKIDNRSGPTGDARIYREGKLCTEKGLASGNTLMVLGYEEKLRRQAIELNKYLDGPPPTLPLEIMNGKDFFSE